MAYNFHRRISKHLPGWKIYVNLRRTIINSLLIDFNLDSIKTTRLNRQKLFSMERYPRMSTFTQMGLFVYRFCMMVMMDNLIYLTLIKEWSAALTVQSVCLSILSMLSSAKRKIKPYNDVEFCKRSKGRGPKSFSWSYDDDNVWIAVYPFCDNWKYQKFWKFGIN